MVCSRRTAGEIHPKFRAPAHAVIAQAIWSGVLVLSGTLSQLVNYTGFAVVLFSAVAVSAVFVLRRRQPHEVRPFRAWGYPWAPAAFVIASAAMLGSILVNTPLKSSSWGLAIIAAGLPIYWWMRRGARESVNIEIGVVRCRHQVSPPQLPDRLQIALVLRRLVEPDPHVEGERLVSRRSHFDPMRTGREMKPLEHPVEVVDDADVVAVDEDLRVARLDLQPQRAVGEGRVGGWIAVATVRGIAIPAVKAIASITSIPGRKRIVEDVRIVKAPVVATEADTAETPWRVAAVVPEQAARRRLPAAVALSRAARRCRQSVARRAASPLASARTRRRTRTRRLDCSGRRSPSRPGRIG